MSTGRPQGVQMLRQFYVCIKVMSDLITALISTEVRVTAFCERLNHSNKAVLTCLNPQKRLSAPRLGDTLPVTLTVCLYVLFVCCCYFSLRRSLGQKHSGRHLSVAVLFFDHLRFEQNLNCSADNKATVYLQFILRLCKVHFRKT